MMDRATGRSRGLRLRRDEHGRGGRKGGSAVQRASEFQGRALNVNEARGSVRPAAVAVVPGAVAMAALAATPVAAVAAAAAATRAAAEAAATSAAAGAALVAGAASAAAVVLAAAGAAATSVAVSLQQGAKAASNFKPRKEGGSRREVAQRPPPPRRGSAACRGRRSLPTPSLLEELSRGAGSLDPRPLPSLFLPAPPASPTSEEIEDQNPPLRRAVHHRDAAAGAQQPIALPRSSPVSTAAVHPL